MTGEAELLLFEAARRQHLAQTVEPALARGEIVLCDRFADSTTAYQGAGRDIGPAKVAWLNAFACGGRKPDLTLLLDVDAAVGLKRAGRHKGRRDRMEKAGLEFHKRVRRAFLKIARANPRRVKVIQIEKLDAAAVLDQARHKVQACLQGRHGLKRTAGK
jgi:dTMP kinase